MENAKIARALEDVIITPIHKKRKCNGILSKQHFRKNN